MAAEPAKAPDGLASLVKPFFAQHCVGCHGEKKTKADLRVDTLIMDFDSPKIMAHWMEIMERINRGDMPPKGAPRPKPDDVARVAEWIARELNEAEAARQSSAKERVSFHRLSREEYANTIPRSAGGELQRGRSNRLAGGSRLARLPAHWSRCSPCRRRMWKSISRAAESILNEALPAGPQPKREVTHWSAFDFRGWKGFEKEYRARGIADQVRVDIVPNNGSLDEHFLTVNTTGDYLVRVKLSGLRPEGGRAPRLRIYASGIGRLLFEQDVDTTEDKPVTLEFPHALAQRRPFPSVSSRRGAGAQSGRPPFAPRTVKQHLHRSEKSFALADEIHR